MAIAFIISWSLRRSSCWRLHQVLPHGCLWRGGGSAGQASRGGERAQLHHLQRVLGKLPRPGEGLWKLQFFDECMEFFWLIGHGWIGFFGWSCWSLAFWSWDSEAKLVITGASYDKRIIGCIRSLSSPSPDWKVRRCWAESALTSAKVCLSMKTRENALEKTTTSGQSQGLRRWDLVRNFGQKGGSLCSC